MDRTARGSAENPWFAPRVVLALISDARTLRDRIWIVLYFVTRLRIRGARPFAAMAPRPRKLSWTSATASLFVSVESGGLSPWYETSILQVYAPTDAFVPRAGWTVVDVGANIGAYSVWAGAQIGPSGRLLAVEPNPVSFELLRRSLDALPMHVTAVPAACGDTDGEVTLHFERGYTVSSSITEFASATESVPTRMRRLEDLLREASIERVDILKIDVEGAEELVLRGAGPSIANVARVVLETTEGSIGSAVRALLASHGFSLAHEEQRHWAIEGLELLAFEKLSPAESAAP